MVQASPCLAAPALALAVGVATCLQPLPLLAQGKPHKRLVPIGQPGKDETWQCTEPQRRGLAATADGSLWTIARVWDSKRNQLRLFRSRDGGRSWRQVAETSTDIDGLGAIVGSRHEHHLHVAWDAGKFKSVYYQAFDTTKEAWVGKPHCLIQGRTENDQYYLGDIERTGMGTLAIAIVTHRRPTQGKWTTNWCGGMFLKKAGDDDWSEPQQINVGYSGVCPNIVAVGEVLHLAFRSHEGGAGVHHRAYDTVAGKWLQQKEVLISAYPKTTPKARLESANNGSLIADPSGNLYVLYAAGRVLQPGHGFLELAFRKAGKEDRWDRQKVCGDAALYGGNYELCSASLARGPGHQIYVVYSKAAEKHKNLYYRVYEQGRPVGNQIRIAAGDDPGAFERVTGNRSSQFWSTMFAAVSGRTKDQPKGRVMAFGLHFPAKVYWDRRE